MFLVNWARQVTRLARVAGDWLTRRPKAWASYVALLAAGSVCWFFYRVLNTTVVEGYENIPRRGREMLIVANHKTIYDSFLLGIAGFFPGLILYPARPPYNLAAEENFKRFFPITTILSLLRVMYVKPGRRDPKLLRLLNRLVSKRNFLIFYQGGRSDNLKQFKAWSIPYIVSERLKDGQRIDIVPVYHDGNQHIFGGEPGKRTWKRWVFRNPFSWFRRKLIIRFGKPIDFTDLAPIKDRRSQYEAIKNRIIDRIELLAHETS